MSELLEALKKVEKLEASVARLEEEKFALERTNYLLRTGLREKYPLFMFASLDPKASKPILYKNASNYYEDRRLSFREFKQGVLEDIYDMLRSIEKALEPRN